MATVGKVDFETGDFSQCALTSSSPSPSILTVPVFQGKYAATIVRTAQTCNFEIRGNINGQVTAYYNLGVVWYLFYFLAQQFPSSGDSSVVNFQDTSSGLKGAIHVNSSGFPVYYDSAGTLIYNSSTKLSLQTWYAFGAKIGTGTGSIFEIQINGITDYTTNTAVNVGTTNNGSIKFGGNSPYTDYYCFDYIVIDNAGYPVFAPTNPRLRPNVAEFEAMNPAILSPGATTYFLPRVRTPILTPRAVLAAETRPDAAFLVTGETSNRRGIVPVTQIKPPPLVLSVETLPQPFPPAGESWTKRGIIPVAVVKPPLPALVQQIAPSEALLAWGFASTIFGGPAAPPPRPVCVVEDAPVQPYPPPGLAYASHAMPPVATVKPPVAVLAIETIPAPFPPLADTVGRRGVVPVAQVKPPPPLIAVASDPVPFPPPGLTQTSFVVQQPAPPIAGAIIAATEFPQPYLVAAGLAQASRAMPLLNIKPPLPVTSREDAPVQPFPPPGFTQAIHGPAVQQVKTPAPVIAREDATAQPFPPAGSSQIFVGPVRTPTVKPPLPVVAREDAPLQPFPVPGEAQFRAGKAPVVQTRALVPIVAREDVPPWQPYPGSTQTFVGTFSAPRVRVRPAVISSTEEPAPFPGFVRSSAALPPAALPPPSGPFTIQITAPTTTYPVQPTITIQVFDSFGNPGAGMVSLSVDGAPSLSAALDVTGTAKIALFGLLPGDHALAVSYNG